jgi:LPXTG-site transpeptidase (sortase) family protein
MRPDVTATVAVLAGLGLGLGVMVTTGSAGEPSTPGSPTDAAEVADAPATDPVPSTAAPVTITRSPADPSPKPERSSRGSTYGKGRIVPGRPVSIDIPRLGVETTVSGISAVGGTLVPPADYTTVGWWQDGPAPGAQHGTAIITGHTVHSGGGAFDELGDLRPGDRVIVARSRRDLEYVVSSVRSYRKGHLAKDAGTVFSGDVEGRVALVTCEDWNGEIYLRNVVVIATNPRPLRDRS